MFRSMLAALSLALLGTPALAVDMPKMKPGLWESRVMGEGAPPKMGATQICMDAALQKEMLDMSMGTMKSMCTKNDVRRDGNRMYVSAECKFGEAAMKSSSVTTFTGDIGYRTEVKTTYDPPLKGKAAATTVVEGKWIGSCPSGMAAGDITLADGRKMNMRALTGGAK
jgi:uncharacterized protein DUF3617